MEPLLVSSHNRLLPPGSETRPLAGDGCAAGTGGHPVGQPPAVPGVDHEVVRRALVQATAGAGIEALELTLRSDIVLCWRLMRYIASSNFGLMVPIDSLHRALDLVGVRRLARWLRLALNCVPDATPAARRLNASAVLRARLLQLIGAEYFEGQDLDNLFLVGAFSVLPEALLRPMPEALGAIVLPDGVADALISRQGRFGALLNLADAMQAGNEDRVVALCDELSLSGTALARARQRATAPNGGTDGRAATLRVIA